MKRKFKISIGLTLFAALLALSCNKTEKHYPDRPEQKAVYELAVSPNNDIVFEQSGGRVEITVDAKKTVHTYVDGVVDDSKDRTIPADFIVSMEDDDFIKYEMDGNKIIITAMKNDDIRLHSVNMVISMKRKPDIAEAINVRLYMEPIHGEEYYICDMTTSPVFLEPFPYAGGTRKIKVTSSNKVMKFTNGVYVEDSIVDAPFNVAVEGEGFSYTVDGNVINVTASAFDEKRSGKATVILVDDPSKNVSYDLLQFECKYPSMPLEHPFTRLAEYNIGKTPKKFLTTHENTAAGMYKLSDAKNACPDGYHLLTLDEIGTFMLTKPEAVKYGSGPAYRIVDDIAFKYEKVGNFVNGNNDAHLMITARNLGGNNDSPDDIKAVGYWDEDNGCDLVKIFPMIGRNGEHNDYGSKAQYWIDGPTVTFFMGANDAYLNPGGYSASTLEGVRCVRNL